MSATSVQRSFRLVEMLADHPRGMALSAIAQQLGLPKSATHRLLTALAEAGFVRQLPETQHYQLTLRLTALGFRFLEGSGLNEVCQPVIERLAASTGELVRIAVVEGEGMTWVAKAQGTHSGLRYDPDMGHRVVLHATAVGKAWLASIPEERALALVARAGLATPARFGPRAVRTLAALRSQLRETRRRGYGEAVEEGAPGIAAVAAAIEGPGGAVVGTVSIAGPVARLGAERRRALAGAAIAAAAELSALWPIRDYQKRAAGQEPREVEAPVDGQDGAERRRTPVRKGVTRGSAARSRGAHRNEVRT